MKKNDLHKKSLELLDEFLSVTPKAELDALFHKHDKSNIKGPTLKEYFDYLDEEVGSVMETKIDESFKKNFIEVKVPDFHNKYDYSKFELKDYTTFNSLIFEVKNRPITEWIKIDHMAIFDAFGKMDPNSKLSVSECKNFKYPPDKKVLKKEKKDSASKQSLFFLVNIAI